jgi:hypothetical protein
VLIADELTEQVIGRAIGVILEIKSIVAILPSHEAQLHTRSGQA